MNRIFGRIFQVSSKSIVIGPFSRSFPFGGTSWDLLGPPVGPPGTPLRPPGAPWGPWFNQRRLIHYAVTFRGFTEDEAIRLWEAKKLFASQKTDEERSRLERMTVRGEVELNFKAL